MSSTSCNKTTTESNTSSNLSESKEMEQVSSNQIQDMKNPKELFDLSRKFYKEKEYESVFEPLQKALDILKNSKHPNDETHVEFAEYYLLYGKTLLRLHQSKNNVFGMDDDGDIPEEETEQGEENEISPQAQDVPLISDSTESKEKSNDKKNVDTPEEKNGEESNNIESNDVSDTELCWQYLELARLSLEKFLKKFESNNNNDNNNNNNNTNDAIELNDENKVKYNKVLADVHSFIGDFLLEDGQAVNSLNEYEKSIKLLNSVNGNKRDLASMHFLASIAAQHDGDIEKIDYHQGESEMLLVEYIKDLLLNNNFEIKENDEELTFEILKNHVNNFLLKNKDNDKYKMVIKELEDVTQTLDDLCQRNDTTGPGENDEKIEGFDMSEFHKLLSQPDGFKALITSEMIKNLKAPKIDNKENTDNSNVEKKGVTTFGFNDVSNGDKNEKVNELSSSCIRSKRPQKRKLDESNVSNEHVPESKRIKLNPTSNSSD